ncbi:hypothetical protein E2C01_050099 [Portunus trituberculatus]|uniref:Uncharacterized protein n=1 Tax=Portunus trituberculatus TaxID=210409 RepID=A0A5B7GEZ4_PORTR|nr:hypothetical protein [Portunus trituberculatus]
MSGKVRGCKGKYETIGPRVSRPRREGVTGARKTLHSKRRGAGRRPRPPRPSSMTQERRPRPRLLSCCNCLNKSSSGECMHLVFILRLNTYLSLHRYLVLIRREITLLAYLIAPLQQVPVSQTCR